MMNRLLLLTLVVIIGGCGNPNGEKIAELKKECIEIHDDVMPQWQDIAEMSGELKKWKVTLQADSVDSIQQLKSRIGSSIELLDSAYDSMGDWMSDYVPDMEQTQSADSALKYYQAEKERITAVNKLMKLSIEDGKELLESKTRP